MGPDDGAVPAAAVRAVVEELPAGPSAVGSRLVSGQRCLIVDDGSGVAPLLAELRADGVAVEVTPIDRPVLEDGVAPDAVVVVDLAGRGAPAVFDALAPAALAGTRWLGCVSVAGAAGGHAGLLRALQVEVPDRTVRSVIVPPNADAATVAAWIREELTLAGPLDVRRAGSERLTSRVTVSPRRSTTDAPVVDPGAVVLLTGGARGITAQVARRLAEVGAAHVHLVGRTPTPVGDEDPETASATDPRALRQLLASRGEVSTPQEIEATCRKILANREVRQTLDAIRAAGSEVHYHSLDVRDSTALSDLVASCAAAHGRLDGIVHGAGVIEDRFLSEKTPESYRRVFDTKVSSARALLQSVPPDVGFVVLFGSVSGVFGNRGQVDYAAANSALDTLACFPPEHLAGRVLSVDWGPWGGSGMVSEELAKSYTRRGIGLIEPADGLAALFEELAHRHETGQFAQPQVVVARADLSSLSAAGEAGP